MLFRSPKDMDAVKMKYDSLEEQSKDKYSIYNYYKDVIKLRNTYPEIARGNTEYIEEISGDNICAIKKIYKESEVMLIMNISEEEQTVDVSQILINGKEIDGSKSLKGVLLTDEKEVAAEGTNITLPAYAIVLYH